MLINMICLYYVFDISYPKQLYPVLLFMQRFIAYTNCINEGLGWPRPTFGLRLAIEL